MVEELLEITRGMQRRLVMGGGSIIFMDDPEKVALNPLGVNLDTPIEELDLSVRTYNNLKRAGIYTIGRVATKTRSDLLDIRNMGSKHVDEIREKLQELRLDLLEE